MKKVLLSSLIVSHEFVANAQYFILTKKTLLFLNMSSMLFELFFVQRKLIVLIVALSFRKGLSDFCPFSACLLKQKKNYILQNFPISVSVKCIKRRSISLTTDLNYITLYSVLGVY